MEPPRRRDVEAVPRRGGVQGEHLAGVCRHAAQQAEERLARRGGQAERAVAHPDVDEQREAFAVRARLLPDRAGGA